MFRIVFFLPLCSDNILTEVSPSAVYILGGLVDESVTKNLTLTKSFHWNFSTARLPIQGKNSDVRKLLLVVVACSLVLICALFLSLFFIPLHIISNRTEFMERTSRDVKCGTSFNYVLTVNQVFDILSDAFRGGDWPKALSASVPRRKGFVLKNQD